MSEERLTNGQRFDYGERKISLEGIGIYAEMGFLDSKKSASKWRHWQCGRLALRNLYLVFLASNGLESPKLQRISPIRSLLRKVFPL